MTSEGDHYFSGEPDVASSPGLVDLPLPDMMLRLHADRGVFASRAVDAGTRYLLLEGPPVDPGATRILDLGCGYGPIAVVLARRAPEAAIWAVDVNERALALAEQNAADLENVTVARPDQVPVELAFDEIWSNPPIRIGKSRLHDLVGDWLDRLTPGGRAVFVVQRHLGADSLARWLVERGHPVERLGSRMGYRLLQIGPRCAS